jgi:hypothetical protein
MTSSEAGRLLCRGDERLCITFSRAPDGTIITADRVPGFSPLRRPFAGLSIAALATFIGVSQPPAVLGARPPAAQNVSGNQAAASPKQTAKKREGKLSGTIYDPNQAVIPSAVVKVRNDVTGEEFTAQSEEDGTYRLPLPKGIYTVHVTYQYFMPYIVTGVKVRSGRSLQLDATLQPAIIGEYVPVPYEETRSKFSKVLAAPFRALKKLFGG